MKTIDKVKNLVTARTSDDQLSKMTSLPTPDLINENIIMNLMIAIRSDVNALRFCDVMENLVDNRSAAVHIEMLRNGNFIQLQI